MQPRDKHGSSPDGPSSQSAYVSWRRFVRWIDAVRGVQTLRTLGGLDSWAHRRMFIRWVVERRLGIPYREPAAPEAAQVTRDGYVFEPRTGSADRHVLGPFHEVQTRSLLRRRLARKPARGVFIDVGAHCGSLGIPFESFFERVLCIEPLPENHRALKRNIALNGLQGKVTPFHFAAGAAHARSAFFLKGDEMSSLVPSDGASAGTLSVDVRRLDDLLKKEGVSPADVRLLKADVEGAELAVLEGARRLLREGSPIVVLEANGPAAKEGVQRFMEDIGYVLIRLTDGRNMSFERLVAQRPPFVFACGLSLRSFLSRRTASR